MRLCLGLQANRILKDRSAVDLAAETQVGTTNLGATLMLVDLSANAIIVALVPNGSDLDTPVDPKDEPAVFGRQEESVLK